MRKTDVIATSLAMLVVVTSCTNSDYRQEVRIGGAKGKFFVTKMGTAIPLSDDKDVVDYEVGSKKLRIFTGTGGRALSIKFDRDKNLLIISYCGGRLEKVESSFSDVLSTDGEGWRIYRTQVINNPGFRYGATPVCL